MPHMDLLDWLQFSFGFQLEDGAVDELMKNFFKNYTEWCKFLGRKSNIRLPYLKQEAQQYKLLFHLFFLAQLLFVFSLFLCFSVIVA
ncbi:hypothetical protein ACS0TY_001213 [Phlomoides rotata]